jgi:hypothetical protein
LRVRVAGRLRQWEISGSAGVCRQPFDTFATRGVCPHCGAQYSLTMCLDCREQHAMDQWVVGAHAGMGMVSGSFEAK